MKITCKFNADGDTNIKYDISYENQFRVNKLDFLQDILFMIEEKYNEEYNKFISGDIE